MRGMMTNSIDRDQWLNVTSESRESQQIVRCIPYKLAFQTSCHLIYVPLRLKKKKLGVVAHFREQICKNHMRQNVGKEK
jgi:hypothetical protein